MYIGHTAHIPIFLLSCAAYVGPINCLHEKIHPSLLVWLFGRYVLQYSAAEAHNFDTLRLLKITRRSLEPSVTNSFLVSTSSWLAWYRPTRLITPCDAADQQTTCFCPALSYTAAHPASSSCIWNMIFFSGVLSSLSSRRLCGVVFVWQCCLIIVSW